MVKALRASFMRRWALVFSLLVAPTTLWAQNCERSYDEFDQAEEIDCAPVEAEYMKSNRRPIPKVWAYWRQKSNSYVVALQIYAETGDAIGLIRADEAQLIVDEWHGSMRVDPNRDGYTFVHLFLDSTLVRRVARADTMKVRVAGWPFEISKVTDQVARLIEMTTDPSFAQVPKQSQDEEVDSKKKSTPYNIEGLDREPQFAPLPAYTEQVNARIRFRITVNPDGQIVKQVPLIKGNPKLEAALRDALQRWRFNPLPPEAQQKTRTGTITFTFRLE